MDYWFSLGLLATGAQGLDSLYARNRKEPDLAWAIRQSRRVAFGNGDFLGWQLPRCKRFDRARIREFDLTDLVEFNGDEI